MNVLGIDASLRSSGWAIVNGQTLELLDFGVIKTKKTSDENIDQTICDIAKELLAYCQKYNVQAIGIEDGFVGKNMKTALTLARVRQGIITGLMMNGVQVVYLQPSLVRSILMQNGSASKEEVAARINFIYQGNERIAALGPFCDKNNKQKNSDIYDAIGVGIATSCTINPHLKESRLENSYANKRRRVNKPKGV